MTTDRDQGDMPVQMPTLSVTYGAFSLTLEGFEDPFATMRDVADYFRAVLAEDRGFGAAAAAPRAEALRRLAERRTGRPVDARAAGDRVHLRAAGSQPPPAPGALFDEDDQPAARDPGPQGAADADLSTPPPAAAEAAPDDPFAAALAEAPADAFDDRAPGAGLTDEGDLPPAPATGRRGGLPADEAAVDRLISQTDSALSGAEVQRRQATFAHLKAAVAATRAEAGDGAGRRGNGQTAAKIARYRDDLVQSVGSAAEARAPRRPAPPEPTAPEASPSRTAPPAATIPAPPATGAGAPLILAAARRIEAEPPTLDALFDEGAPGPEPSAEGFARFRAAAGPADLAETLDAAAAYLAHVEGMEDFPRPQLLRLIARLPEAADREAVMRALGVLLREEKLARSRRGQFQSGPRSAYAEAARRFRRQR